MSNAPLSTQTEKDMKELNRERFAQGWLQCARDLGYYSMPGAAKHWEGRAREEAVRKFPDPPQPREITIGDELWRYVDGRFEFRRVGPNGCWVSAAMSHQPNFICALYDLLNNPVVSHG